MELRCIYCGRTHIFRKGCQKSPHGYHEFQTDSKHCRFCGSSSSPGSCSRSPIGIHKRGMDGKTCVYCGHGYNSSSCSLSPTKKHELN